MHVSPATLRFAAIVTASFSGVGKQHGRQRKQET
jgi:hypothetical protein